MTRPKTPGRVKPIEEKTLSGRPRKEAPPDAADVIRNACATGATRKGVAMALACSEDVLARWLDEDPALKEAFGHGRELERATLHNVLYKAATTGTGKDALIAAMFLLKCRHPGYNDSGNATDQANKVSITFNIPAAQPLNDFMVIDNDPTNDRTKQFSAKLTRSS